MSTEAQSVREFRKQYFTAVIGVPLLVIAGIAALAAFGDTQAQAPASIEAVQAANQSAPTSFPTLHARINSRDAGSPVMVACRSKDIYTAIQAASVAARGDEEKMASGADQIALLVKHGDCSYVADDTTVTLLERDDDLLRFRVDGDMTSLWALDSFFRYF
jgi:hypothetical protein